MAGETLVFDEVQSVLSVAQAKGESLFNRIVDYGFDNFDFLRPQLNPDLYMKELPLIDIAGMGSSEPEQPVKSLVGSLIDGARTLFGNEDPREQLRKDCQEKMSSVEQRQWEREEKAINEYKKQLLSWQTFMTLNPPPAPLRPETPMHDEIERRVSQVEKEHGKGQRWIPDADRLVNELISNSKPFANPLGTGEFFKSKN